MQLPDLVNALFELTMGVMSWQSVCQLIKDKQIRGVSTLPAWTAAAWGYFNLYYYPHLGQWFSLAAGILVVSGNSVWCFFAWRYRNA